MLAALRHYARQGANARQLRAGKVSPSARLPRHIAELQARSSLTITHYARWVQQTDPDYQERLVMQDTSGIVWSHLGGSTPLYSEVGGGAGIGVRMNDITDAIRPLNNSDFAEGDTFGYFVWWWPDTLDNSLIVARSLTTQYFRHLRNGSNLRMQASPDNITIATATTSGPNFQRAGRHYVSCFGVGRADVLGAGNVPAFVFVGGRSSDGEEAAALSSPELNLTNYSPATTQLRCGIATVGAWPIVHYALARFTLPASFTGSSIPADGAAQVLRWMREVMPWPV